MQETSTFSLVQIVGVVGVLQIIVLAIMAYILKNVENAILRETAAIKEWAEKEFVRKETFRQFIPSHKWGQESTDR